MKLLLDDHEVQLQSADGSLRDLGIGKWPLSTPGRDALLVMYAVDPLLFGNLGHTAQLRARPEPAADLPPDLWFDTWRDARVSFGSFADKVVGPP